MNNETKKKIQDILNNVLLSKFDSVEATYQIIKLFKEEDINNKQNKKISINDIFNNDQIIDFFKRFQELEYYYHTTNGLWCIDNIELIPEEYRKHLFQIGENENNKS